MFARLIDPDLLDDLIADPRLRDATAKKVDEILASDTTVIYGSMLEDGSAIDWSSEKTYLATHVGLLVAPRAMAAFARPKANLRTDKLGHNDMVKAQEAQIKALKHENLQLRRGKSE